METLQPESGELPGRPQEGQQDQPVEPGGTGTVRQGHGAEGADGSRGGDGSCMVALTGMLSPWPGDRDHRSSRCEWLAGDAAELPVLAGMASCRAVSAHAALRCQNRPADVGALIAKSFLAKSTSWSRPAVVAGLDSRDGLIQSVASLAIKGIPLIRTALIPAAPIATPGLINLPPNCTLCRPGY